MNLCIKFISVCVCVYSWTFSRKVLEWRNKSVKASMEHSVIDCWPLTSLEKEVCKCSAKDLCFEWWIQSKQMANFKAITLKCSVKWAVGRKKCVCISCLFLDGVTYFSWPGQQTSLDVYPESDVQDITRLQTIFYQEVMVQVLEQLT